MATVLSSDNCIGAQLFYGAALCQTEPWRTTCCGGGDSYPPADPAGPLRTLGGDTSAPSGPPAMLGGCGACRRSAAAAAAAGGTAAEIAAALERPGPIGLPWWVWVLLTLVVLNLLRS